MKAEDAKTYDTVVFEGPPLMKQRLWPRHCVQDSWGAELHKDLKVCHEVGTTFLLAALTLTHVLYSCGLFSPGH